MNVKNNHLKKIYYVNINLKSLMIYNMLDTQLETKHLILYMIHIYECYVRVFNIILFEVRIYE